MAEAFDTARSGTPDTSDGVQVAGDTVTEGFLQAVYMVVGATGSYERLTAGAGAVAAGTLRVTEASDAPSVSLLTSIASYLDTEVASLVTQVTAAAASLSVLDDWDETDRCKVNIIAGQVGVAGGSGASSALTQRVVLATDDPAVALLTTIATYIDTEVASLVTQTTAAAASLSVLDDWDSTDACKVVGIKKIASATFTRPSDTTAYASGDVVSNSTSATTPMTLAVGRVTGGSGYIVAVKLTTDKVSVTARFRLHIYKVVNPTLSVDNAAHQDKYADDANKIGFIDLLQMTGGGSGSSNCSYTITPTSLAFVCTDTNLYCVLEAIDAFTPASAENFALYLTVEQD